MATFLFKNPDFLKKADSYLSTPLVVPSGEIREVDSFSGLRFSQWLGFQLESDLSSCDGWLDCHPVLLGSWARQELCLKSDLDVIFCGEEEAVFKLVNNLQERGIKLRYRVPQNPKDWQEGVEIFDILALLQARPLTAKAAQELFLQHKLIWSNLNKLSKKVLKTLQGERSLRSQRHDSLANYLEPNLKFGPGGLRDIQQALQVQALFARDLDGIHHAMGIFGYYKSYLLTLRHKIHLSGGGDLFSAPLQHELYPWLGFPSHGEAMRSLQRGLSRVHFYSDWILEAATQSEKVKPNKMPEIKKHKDLVVALQKDASTLVQKQVREKMDLLVDDLTPVSLKQFRKQALNELNSLEISDEQIIAFFRSRLIDKALPEIKRLIGHVQHDQYHRFTVDTHILQARREVQRLYSKTSLLGAMKFVAAKLDKKDWQILAWVSLYHDIGKGKEGDHSSLGEQICRKDLTALGFDRRFVEDVCFLVRHHLELSKAAFKLNPHSVSTWQMLTEKGLRGKNLYRLAVFTCADIRATNPDAWNEWKSQMLAQLVKNVETPEAEKQVFLKRELTKKKIPLDVDSFDSYLVSAVNPQTLLRDINLCFAKDESQGFKLFKSKNGVWVRFHQKENQIGVLKEVVSKLVSAGFGIQHASVQTIEGLGVYDWFKLSGRVLSEPQFYKKMKLSESLKKDLSQVIFQDVSWIHFEKGQGILSFKAIDQSGLLLKALESLSHSRADVLTAKVHTWGKQVEDTFEVRIAGDPEELLQHLRATLLRKK